MIDINSRKKINLSKRILEKFWKFSKEFQVTTKKRSDLPDFILNQFDSTSPYSSGIFYVVKSDINLIKVLKELGKSLKSNIYFQVYLFSHSLFIVYKDNIYSNSEDGLKSLLLSRV